jgi:hypothetical protein
MIAHFLSVVLAFPSVVYSVLLGVSVSYWLFVMIGAAHIDALGEGGADVGGHDAFGTDAGAHDAGGHDAGDGGDGGDAGAGDVHLTGILASLKLRSAPATVVLSVLILFSWLLCVLGAQALAAFVPTVADSLLLRVGLFLLAPLVSLPFTSLAIRPLARIFAPVRVARKEDLVGKIATVRTGTVTDTFGEALLEDGGAGLVVRVRVDPGTTIGRGAQVVIVSYDEERQEFTVAPVEDLMNSSRPR